MGEDAKYIVFQLGTNERKLLPILFPGKQIHADVAALFESKGWIPRSAGFVRFCLDGSPRTYGESVSLGVSYHADDDRVILTEICNDY